MSDLRVTNLKGRTAGSAPTLPDGAVIAGVLTATTIGSSSDTITIPGNLTVNGAQTIINTTSLEITDKNIGIGSTSSPSNALAD